MAMGLTGPVNIKHTDSTKPTINCTVENTVFSNNVAALFSPTVLYQGKVNLVFDGLTRFIKNRALADSRAYFNSKLIAKNLTFLMEEHTYQRFLSDRGRIPGFAPANQTEISLLALKDHAKKLIKLGITSIKRLHERNDLPEVKISMMLARDVTHIFPQLLTSFSPTPSLWIIQYLRP
jgi:hypothetical protein